MDKKIKKIKILSIICLFLILFESVIGCAMLYTGIIYREFDKNNAKEMLDIIQYTDKNYYDKLMDSTDTSYLKEFQQIHTIKGNSVLKVTGVIIIIISVLSMLPVLMMINVVFDGVRKKKEPEEKPTEKTKEEAPK